MIYKVRSEESKDAPECLKGADTEEKIVYGLIQDAGNKGIWMRDIRFESKLQPTVLNKILKSLENKKIIKAVKSVAVSQYYYLVNITINKPKHTLLISFLFFLSEKSY